MAIARDGEQPPARAPGAMRRRESGHLLLYVFALTFLIPDVISLNLGGVRLPVIRLFLVVAAIPVMISFLTAQKRIYAFEGVYIAFIVWTMMCMLINHGQATDIVSGIEKSGVFLVEYLVAYMIVVVAMTSIDKIRIFINAAIMLIGVLGVLAMIESLSYDYILMNIANRFIGRGDYVIFDDPGQAVRLGLWRATSVFKHPILYGLFCAVFLAFAWYLARDAGRALRRGAVIVFATFFSLSAGSLVALLIQGLCIGIEVATRGIAHRARLIFWGVAGFLLFVQIAAESGVYRLVQMVTMTGGSAYYRKLIWEQSIDDVLRNPIFGMRPEDWEKPFWMTESLDNHWVIQMMNGGIPSILLLFAALLMIRGRLFRRPDRDLPADLAGLRRAWAFAVLGMALAGATVAFFDKLPPLFAMLIGIGGAACRLIDAAEAPREARPAPRRPRAALG